MHDQATAVPHALWHGCCFQVSRVGNVTTLRRPGKPESCVVGDHVYLVLNRAQLLSVVDALHPAGDQALEQRLAEILHHLPPSGRPYVRSLRAKPSLSWPR